MKFIAAGFAFLLPLWAADAPKASTNLWKEVAARATSAREANRIDEAIGLYQKALRSNPRWEEGWWFVGSLSYDKDRYAECSSAFTRFTALNKKSGPAFVMLGLCDFQLKKYDNALRHIRTGEAVGLPEDSPLTRAAYFHEALLVTKLENYERALFLLSLLIKNGEENPQAVGAMGIAALRRPLFPKELPAEDRPLAMRVGSAIALGFQRRPAQAREAFESVVRENPQTPNLHYTYGTFLLGQDAEAAVREWKQELELSPKHLPSLVSLAFEYLTRGDYQSARPFAERAMETAPDHFTSRAAMGRVLLESGDALGAIPHLEMAARLAPDSPQVRLALGTAYSRAGRPADAARERDAFAALKKTASPVER
jgi:tetratricopeptide (TPR) repeat protein